MDEQKIEILEELLASLSVDKEELEIAQSKAADAGIALVQLGRAINEISEAMSLIELKIKYGG